MGTGRQDGFHSVSVQHLHIDLYDRLSKVFVAAAPGVIPGILLIRTEDRHLDTDGLEHAHERLRHLFAAILKTEGGTREINNFSVGTFRDVRNIKPPGPVAAEAPGSPHGLDWFSRFVNVSPSSAGNAASINT